MACGSPRPLFAALRQAENMQLAVLALPVAFSCSRRGNPPPCPFRCFLTRRIEYFRAPAPSLANTRKSEAPDAQTHPCEAPPQRGPKTTISPLYGTFRPHFSSEKWPWMRFSMGWIGDSMGWKSKSMGWIAREATWTGGNLAKRRTSVGVRLNALPYSAQGPAQTKSHRPAAWRGGG